MIPRIDAKHWKSVFVVVVAATVVSFAGCTSSRQLAGSQNGGDGGSEASQPISATSPQSSQPTAAPTEPSPPQTPVVTEAPTTTAAPTTTTTTTAPTTTLSATTTTTIPRNIVAVAKSVEPIPIVGTRDGAETAVVQARLTELGFWLAGVDGDYGTTTSQAVMAFQKYVGLPATGKVDDWTAFALGDITEKPHGLSDTGNLFEIDKGRQLLFVVVDGRTQLIFNTSTGNGEEYTEEDQNTPGELITGVSLTPDGLFKTDRERPEGWWEGDLGKIYRPKYFIGGIAVHGSGSVPNYPASHGCVRVTTQAMDFIWDSGIMPLGTTVWVHG